MSTSFHEIIDCQVTGSESLCEELISGIKISQSFRCNIDNLNCIEVKFGTYNRSNIGNVSFNLRVKGDQYDLIHLVSRSSDLQDNAYFSFRFSPIRQSAGREFLFSIESPGCNHGSNIAIWKVTQRFFGQRFLNEKPVSGTVVFRSKCSVPETVQKLPPTVYTIPVLKNVNMTQAFTSSYEIIDALSLNLDNYGSRFGSLNISLKPQNGEDILDFKIIANQISNGFPLLIPLPSIKTQNKTFILTITSDDGEVGNAIGVNILKQENFPGGLQVNGEVVKGTVSFDLRGAILEFAGASMAPISPAIPQIIFNQPKNMPVLETPVARISGLVDIITLSYNRADLLNRCYTSLMRNTDYANWRWHVCDNGSRDNSVDVINRLEDSRVSITHLPNNSLSFGEGNNLIFRNKASGEYVLFLNNDVLVGKNWLSEMVTILENDSEVGVVGACLYYPTGSAQHLGIVFRPDGIPVNLSHFLLSPKNSAFFEVDRCFKAVTGACLLMRRSDFEKLGGFPVNYDYGYEDVDLCLNVYYNLKKKIVLCATSKSTHEEAATSKQIKRSGRVCDIQALKKRWNCASDLQQYLTDFRHNVYLGPRVENPTFSIITCVTQPKIWMESVVAPNRRYAQELEIKPVFNFIENLPVTKAYNRELRAAKGKYIIFCHQDLRFYPGWFEKLKQFLKNTSDWGVVGAAGWSVEGKIQGGLITPEKKWSNSEGEAQTVDECFLVVKKSLLFDEKIIEPHLYGLDICLSAINQGFRNYAVQIPVEHRETGAHPDTWIPNYYAALKRIKIKWTDRFPVIRGTTCVLQKGRPDIVGVKPPRKA